MKPARRSNAIVASAHTANTASTPTIAGTSAATRSMYCVGGIRPWVTNTVVAMIGVEQRRHRHVLPVRRGVGIDGDAVREVADLALGEPHVIPRVGLEEIDARAAEHIVPRRPHAKAGGHHQDDGQHDDVEPAQLMIPAVIRPGEGSQGLRRW